MSLLFVTIYYGPILTFSVPVYKKQKVVVLGDRLKRLGYRVDMKHLDAVNQCIIEMCGHEVFRCNINFLGFNMPYENDPVCQKAVAAVLDASQKFLRARSYLWCQRQIEEQMFSRTDYAPLDHFPIEVDFKSFDTDCINCCGILVAKKTKENLEETKCKVTLTKLPPKESHSTTSKKSARIRIQ